MARRKLGGKEFFLAEQKASREAAQAQEAIQASKQKARIPRKTNKLQS